jgi:hypothetical protein
MVSQKIRDLRAERAVCTNQRTHISFLFVVDDQKTFVYDSTIRIYVGEDPDFAGERLGAIGS